MFKNGYTISLLLSYFLRQCGSVCELLKLIYKNPSSVSYDCLPLQEVNRKCCRNKCPKGLNWALCCESL